MLTRLEGEWEDGEEDEFKMLFLICALAMVLCPTQSPRLAKDLIPKLTCSSEAPKYDWCGLVLEKLMRSVRFFSRRFYAEGYVGGAGGCTIFLAILYLDQLARAPLQWGHYPRIGVWSMEDVRKAKQEDRCENGDFGLLGMIDVAYGEKHPLEGRDAAVPGVEEAVEKITSIECCQRKHRRGEARWKNRQYNWRWGGGVTGGDGAFSERDCMNTTKGMVGGKANCPHVYENDVNQADIDLDLTLQRPFNGFIWYV